MKTLFGWGYCMLRTDWREIWRLANEDKTAKGLACIGMIYDLLISSFHYQISPSEYFYFNFPCKGKTERSGWAGTTAMWMAQRRFVPKNITHTFSSKEAFRIKFNRLMAEDVGVIDSSDLDRSYIKLLLEKGEERWFVKPEDGQCGVGGFVLDVGGVTVDELLETLRSRLQKGQKYIVEKNLVNHEVLRAVNPSCLNTVRIVTYTDGTSVEILFCRIRFGNGGDVDNLGSGGYAAEVDSLTGTVNGEAVSTRSGMAVYYVRHPVTGIEFNGIEIPYWGRVKDLVRNAALIEPEASIVGWDVAITVDGVYLLEGNHNWCKLLWQLPVKKGLRSDLNKYIKKVEHDVCVDPLGLKV